MKKLCFYLLADMTPRVKRRKEEDPFSTDHEYMTHLKQIYKIPPPHWGPLPQCELIKLAMIKEKGKRHGSTDDNFSFRNFETTMTGKPLVETDKLFDDGTFDNDRQVILVEGAPGMGKTMLAHHYCQKWESDKLPMFDAVILVPLRELDVKSTSSLADLLRIATAKHPTQTSNEMAQHVARHLINVKILLIFDGWDELPTDFQKNSFLRSIITNPQFVSPQTTILVTSRPDSSLDLHDLANRVEILGFTEHNIHEYFRKSLSTKLAHDKVKSAFIKLGNHLCDYPVIQSCCYVPLNTAILMHVFLHSCEQALPKTRYELFHALVLCLINRERQTRSYVRGLKGVSSFDDPNVKVQLSHICKLAYEGVKQNKAVFNQVELSTYNLPTDISTMGLLLCVEQFTLHGCRTVSYHFLHLSIQELLAAYHISQIKEEGEQVKVFASLLGEPRFSAVLQFYAAITKLTNQGVQNIITGKDFLHEPHLSSHFGNSQQQLRLLLLLNCFFEAQLQDQLYNQIISNLNNKIILYRTTLSPLDCISVGYFLASVLHMTTGELTVDLSYCRITAHSVSLLLDELSKRADTSAGVLQGIVSLNISNNNIGNNGITHIATFLKKYSTLKKLDISGCGITEMGVESLAEALAANSSLKQLNVNSNNIGDSGIVCIAEALKSNSTLEVVDISWCGITAIGTNSLAKALAANRSLKQLNVNSNNIGDSGIVCIAEALKRNSTLEVVDISGCGMAEVGVESLAEIVATKNSLQELDVSSNTIRDNGIVCIGRALKENSTLKQLYLQGCGLTEMGVELLAETLAANSSLKLLFVSDNNIGDNGVVHIAKALKGNSTLEILDVSGCDMTELGVVSFAETLGTNNSLQELYISYNTIGDNGIVYIVSALERNSTLKQLYIQGCGLTEVGVESLAEALPMNHSLEKLVLEWSSLLPGQTLRKMAECVKRSALKELWISLDPRTNEEQLLNGEKEREYLQSLEMGGRDFIQSQEDGHLRLFFLSSPPLQVASIDERSQARKSLRASASSLNLARRGKRLPPIHCLINLY